MKVKTKLAEKVYRYDEAEPVSPETQAMYTWGVFKRGNKFVANTYFKDEQNYSMLVKGDLSRADAEKLAAEKSK